MSLLMLGLSHKTAPVELREALALDGDAYFGAELAPLKRGGLIDEWVLISTCNRVEAYTVSRQPEEAEAALRKAFEKKAGARASQARKALKSLQGDDLLWHLLNVASSLDSMVLGEAQILGQVKDAYEKAVQAKAVGPVFHGLFQRVFAAAKEVRTRTEIGQHAASIPSIAVQLAERLFGELGTRTALVLGAGEMAELTAEHLRSGGVQRLLFCNRSLPKARELAKRFNGEAQGLDGLEALLPQADVLVCSTGAQHYVLTRAQAEAGLRSRQSKPQLLIDIAVPRNIDPACGELENAYLYNLDDLSLLAEEHREKRLAASQGAETILRHRLRDLKEWIAAGRVVPTVSRLSRHFEAVRSAEWERHSGKLEHLAPKDREKIEALTKALVQKLLHPPVQALKKAANSGEKGAELVESVEALYGLSEEEPE
jgi:glutamyl-tRNA reductase